MNVKTIVAKEIFKALEKTIPRGHKLFPGILHNNAKSPKESVKP